MRFYRLAVPAGALPIEICRLSFLMHGTGPVGPHSSGYATNRGLTYYGSFRTACRYAAVAAVIMKSLLHRFIELSSKTQHQRQNPFNLSKLLHVVQVLHYLHLNL